MIRTALLVAAVCAAAAAEPALGDPIRLELYHDGARLVHRVELPAGASRLALPRDGETVVRIDGADGWLIERTSATEPVPEVPAELLALAADLRGLGDRRAAVADREALAEHLEREVAARLPRASRDPAGRAAAWQESVDRSLELRADADDERAALVAEWARIRARAEAIATPSGSAATLLGLPSDAPEATARALAPADVDRRWRAAHERVREGLALRLERRVAGAVTVVTERDDVRWTPHARLTVAAGAATLVRQAVVVAPAGLRLPALPARLATAPRQRPLDGPHAGARHIAGEPAPAGAARSVHATREAVDWEEPADGEAAPPVADQAWDIAALTLGGDRPAIVELQSTPLAVLSDEWLLAPALAPVATRRVSVRLDGRPLLAGELDLAVDGTVLASRTLPLLEPGEVLHLCAGSDERIYLVGSEAWKSTVDGPSHRREGADHRLRNLGADAVSFVCYLTHPVAGAKELTVAVDPATAPGWEEQRPGVLRWRLTLQPGEERVLPCGWTIDAAPGVRL